MAATHKSKRINEEKELMRADIRNLVYRIKSACTKVPRAVIDGSANLAVAWRTEAEKAIDIEPRYPDSATTEGLRKTIVSLNRTLGLLENPRID